MRRDYNNPNWFHYWHDFSSFMIRTWVYPMWINLAVQVLLVLIQFVSDWFRPYIVYTSTFTISLALLGWIPAAVYYYCLTREFARAKRDQQFVEALTCEGAAEKG